MTFYKVQDLKQLEKNTFTYEPIDHLTEIPSHKIAVLFIPCLGYDLQLYRLGRGSNLVVPKLGLVFKSNKLNISLTTNEI